MIPQTPADVPAATVSPEQEGGAVPLVRLLGPIDVVDDDGQAHAPGSPLRRTILALLAVEAGQVVDAERLMDLAWNGEPPDSGLRALRFHISKLRGEIPDELIDTVGSGYRLEAQTDVDRAAEIDPARALDLWRGDPLADVEPCDALDQERRRLDELRLTLSEVGYERRLDRGEADELVAELTRLCEQYPLRERLWACLARAHAGAGHQAEALRAVEQLRVSLRDTLGADLSPPLKELERALLDPESLHRPASVLPTGTVTFLFTDIVGSTAAWEQHHEVMSSAHARHDDLVRDALQSRGAHVFAETGDGFAASFARAADAIRAAVDVQRRVEQEPWPDGIDLHLRVGLHTGEATERSGNYFGPVVNRTARIMGAAAAGQVLVSDATRRIADDHVSSEVGFEDAGELVLRGVDAPVQVFTIAADGLRSIPPSGFAGRGNLPARLEPLVGRDREVEEIGAALETSPVVTLVGIGGVGKTSLARTVGARLGPVTGGVWFVALAEVADAGDIAAAVAQTLGVVPNPGQTVTDALVASAVAQPCVLILDNCEHLVDGAARLVESLVSKAVGIRILATSREALHVGDERVVPVRPLPTDGDDPAAVELFCRRATSVRPDFDATSPADEIAELCRRLDGLPLALELAAARMNSLTPGDVLEHLEERFRLLTGGRRTAVERHQTLRAAVGWSYDLLTPDEQRVLDCVSTFAGRFSLEDAVAVATSDSAGRVDVIDHVDGLVQRSLVDTHDTSPRYSLLETVRAFGRESLGQRSDRDVVARRHAERMRDLAEETRLRCVSPDGVEVLRDLQARLPDHHEAVRWALSQDDLDLAIHIVVDLGAAGVTWNLREPAGWLEHLIDDPPDPLPERWADLLCVCSNRAVHWYGNTRRARELAERARRFDANAALVAETDVLLNVYAGKYEAALESVEPVADGWHMGPAIVPQLWIVSFRTIALTGLGRLDEAEADVAALGEWAERTGSLAVRAVWQMNDGLLRLRRRDPEALARLQQAVRTGEASSIAIGMYARGFLAEALMEVDPAAAAVEYAEALEMGGRNDTTIGDTALRNIAVLAAAQGHHAEAARLVGWAGGLVGARSRAEKQRFERLEVELRGNAEAEYEKFAHEARDNEAALALARALLARIVSDQSAVDEV